jgi:hypothetical protein
VGKRQIGNFDEVRFESLDRLAVMLGTRCQVHTVSWNIHDEIAFRIIHLYYQIIQDSPEIEVPGTALTFSNDR